MSGVWVDVNNPRLNTSGWGVFAVRSDSLCVAKRKTWLLHVPEPLRTASNSSDPLESFQCNFKALTIVFPLDWLWLSVISTSMSCWEDWRKTACCTWIRDIVPVRRIKLIFCLQDLFKQFGVILVIERRVTTQPEKHRRAYTSLVIWDVRELFN